MKKRLVPSTRSLAVALGLLVLLLLIPATTRAQANLHLSCTGSTTCSNGSTTLITSTTTPTFNIVNVSGMSESGTFFLAVLVPNTTASFTVSVGGGPAIAAEESITFTSGHLGDSGNLNESGLKDYEFSALASASAQAPGVTATSFHVYEYNLGSGTCSNGSTCVGPVSVGPLPIGTVIVAWVEDSSGNVLDRTPLSESLTVVPEPGTLVLLGSGLVIVGSFLRRRLGIS